MALNLEKQLLFYGSYHHDPVNIGIHITCVPMILLTGFLFGTNSPDVSLPPWMSIPNFPVNVGTAACLLYTTLYILMEPVAGALIAPILIGGTAFANHLTSTYGMQANYIALGVHVTSWIAQFIGHGVYEKRAPALLDNLLQAFFLAPFFVWLEILFSLGYRPALKERLNTSVEKEIAKFHASKAMEASGTAVNGSAKSR